jgi:hypothetical protein
MIIIAHFESKSCYATHEGDLCFEVHASQGEDFREDFFKWIDRMRLEGCIVTVVTNLSLDSLCNKEGKA